MPQQPNMANDSVIDVLQGAVSAANAGQRAALLTVVRASGSTPRRAGAKMLLREDGTCLGTIGGGTLEERAVLDARQALQEGTTLLAHYDISGQDEASLGLCGGVVDVSIEVLLPPPRLVIIGAGHIAQPLASMASMVGMHVIIIDDRPDWASAERFPTAKEIHVIAYDRATEALAPLPVEITSATAVVLATWGWDEPALLLVLPTPAFYIGLVASRRKLNLISKRLAAQGLDSQMMDRVHAPAGLDLGGDTPGDIALTIMAEIQRTRHATSGDSLRSLRKAARPQ